MTIYPVIPDETPAFNLHKRMQLPSLYDIKPLVVPTQWRCLICGAVDPASIYEVPLPGQSIHNHTGTDYRQRKFVHTVYRARR